MRRPFLYLLSTGLFTFLLIIISDLEIGFLINRVVLKPEAAPDVDRNNERKNSIFFLKMHKCASSAVQNIIMRFGISRELSFVLPMQGNYLGHPKKFDRTMLNPMLSPKNGKFHIFTHHTRYNYVEIKEVMMEQAMFVTILRDPADVMDSMFSYYNLQSRFNFTVNDFIQHPEKSYLMKRVGTQRFGLNQMMFDFGVEESEANSTKFVADVIKKLDTEFDLVMIAEYMEASLILLADLMNWPIEEVRTLKLNARFSDKRSRFQVYQRETLHRLNTADWDLYRFFLRRFYEKIERYGKRRMFSDVKKLLTLNRELKSECVGAVGNKGYAHTVSYTPSNSNWLCIYATKPELTFTDEIREFQIDKLNTLRDLKAFLNSFENYNY